MNTSTCMSGSGTSPPLEAFEGAWEIARDIRDRLAGEDLRFEGQARFEPGAGGLQYTEVGDLMLPRGGTLRATRAYFYREGMAGIEVFFDDGRPFHRIPRGTAPVASHWCDPDAYSVSYDFLSWPEWTTEWEVRGPRKDYRMVTCYRRA